MLSFLLGSVMVLGGGASLVETTMDKRKAIVPYKSGKRYSIAGVVTFAGLLLVIL